MALFRVLQIGQLTILISWPISAVNSNFWGMKKAEFVAVTNSAGALRLAFYKI